jgi:hypothetical protein
VKATVDSQSIALRGTIGAPARGKIGALTDDVKGTKEFTAVFPPTIMKIPAECDSRTDMHDTPDTTDDRKTRYNFVCGGRQRYVSILYNPALRDFRDMRVATIQSPEDFDLYQITEGEGKRFQIAV